jgi:DNA-binding CsgD family transcriptional regulator
MSIRRAEGRFRQLCCLGLAGEAVIPALLAELHTLVPSYFTTFHFADERGDPSNIYSDHPGHIDVMPLYAEVFYERRDREFKGLAYSEASPWQFGVLDADAVLGPGWEPVFSRGDMYNLIGRPLGSGTGFIRLFIRDGRQRRTLGCVKLNGAPRWRAWTAEEKHRLATLEPYFAYALTVCDRKDHPLVDSGHSGVIVADPAGRPVHLSSEARRLLFLATNPRVAPGVAVSRVPCLPAPVVSICRNLSRATSGDGEALAPVYHHRNVWGGFRFCAEWLDGNDPSSGLVAITVTYQEPQPIALMRNVERLPLSPRQAEVCVLMAIGLSLEKIAARLGISKHTANEHSRWIYNKVDVHNRTELVGKLLSGQPYRDSPEHRIQ